RSSDNRRRTGGLRRHSQARLRQVRRRTARRGSQARMTRRVVTGHVNGKAVVVFDGPAPNRKVRQASGIASTLLWVTDESPPDISGTADRSLREIGVPPPPNGSIFRVVEFPPERTEMSREAVLKEMGISGGLEAKHAAM